MKTAVIVLIVVIFSYLFRAELLAALEARFVLHLPFWRALWSGISDKIRGLSGRKG